MIRYLARRRRPALTGTVLVMAALAALLLPASPAAASRYAPATLYTPLQGSGSSWAAVALVQWANDLQSQGLQVNFEEDGSAQGRTDFETGTLVDFAASDPPFRNGDDELAHTAQETVNYNYSYVPDVAGGTAFMYHLTVGGHLVTNLRLSEQTLMKIFTGQITNWDDPEITHDYGAQLPNEQIIPVVRADGSGATYFLTRWMKIMFPTQWNAFCQRVQPGIKLPCPQTEFYPSNLPNVKAESGSQGVSNYITSSYGEGAIGYDEYAYALDAHWPVVQVANPAGYYVLPTASNVAVALTRAQINEDRSSPDFLQQDLDNVYTNPDPRSYPLSSYSYLIVPRTGGSDPLPQYYQSGLPGDGRSLSTYIDYYLCQGQQQAGSLGYSPLPYNLVQGAFLQVQKIPGTVGTPNVNNYGACNNPTFGQGGKNTLLSTAPYPGPCQKVTAPLNCSTGGGSNGGSQSGGGKTKTGATATPTPTSGGTTGATGGTQGPSGSPGSSTGPSGTGTGPSGPGTGTGTGSGSGTGTGTGIADITGSVVNVPGNGADRILLAVLTAMAVAVAVAAPPSVAAYLRRRRGNAR